jgi:hypothetical protein
MIGDFRYALRVLLKTPAYSLIAIVTLALGIDAPHASMPMTTLRFV